MKRATAPNPFRDALAYSGLSLAEAAEVLDRSLPAIQSYASGRREAPASLVSHLCTHAWDVLHTDLDRDRHGVVFPASALAMRRASRDPAVRDGFDAIREALARTPMPDPDGQPFVAVGDMPSDESADRADDRGRPTNNPRSKKWKKP